MIVTLQSWPSKSNKVQQNIEQGRANANNKTRFAPGFNYAAPVTSRHSNMIPAA
jgi:hypothetical protein